jgi:4-hydroxy-3-polyprenylbenzoate decarboxylase
MKTLSAIRVGYSDNLIARAADVTMKERRKLVLVTREAPLSKIHLAHMHFLARAGVVILPPMVQYYLRPKTINEPPTTSSGACLTSSGSSIHAARGGPAATGEEELSAH